MASVLEGSTVRKRIKIVYSFPREELPKVLSYLHDEHATGRLEVHFGQGTPSQIVWDPAQKTSPSRNSPLDT